MTDIESEILTLREVAEFLMAGKGTVYSAYRLVSSGSILAFKLGGTRYFRRQELDRWIESD